MIICSVVSLSAMVLTYKMSQTTSNITKTCNKCTNFIKTIKATTQFVVFLFVHSWEQRKLGDTVQITMGQSPDGSTYSDVPSDYILVQGNADLQNGWVSPRLWTSQMTKKADAGDLIMSVRAPAGAMGKTAYNAVIGRGVAAIKGNEFIYQLLVKMDSDGYWKALSCGSTFESLNSDNIKNADVLIPNAAEQKKIGQYFANLDNLITLHQREFFRLILSFFCCNSTSILPISWEQRKLEDFFTERNERSGNGEMISVTIGSGIKKFDELNRFDKKPDDLSKYKRVEVGDIAYNSMRMWQGASGYSPYSGILSPAYTVITPKNGVSSRFFAYVLKQPKMIHQFEINSQGLTKDTWNLKFPAFAPIEVVAPLQLAEQEKVSELLLQLDNLITLHQCECLGNSHALSILPCPLSSRKMTSFWEQRKFEDLYSYASEGGTPDTNNSSFYKDGTIPFVKIEDTENKYIDSTKSHISVEGLNHSSAWLIPAHNILFTNGATVGNVAINRIPVATKQGILGIIPSKQVTVELMFYLLSSTLFQREVKSRMATGTFATIILKNLNQIPVCIPTNKNEQNLITDYLSQLDNLITLHQCKDFSLKSVFEESKNFISALRKNTSWEQRKVSEMFKVTRGYVLASTLTEAVKSDKKPYPVYSSQTKDNGLMGYYKDYLYEDAITWTTDGANAGTVNYRAGKFYCTNVCGVLLSNEVTANQMIAEALNNVAKGYVSYVGNPKLMNNVMADIEIMIPTQSEEREKLSVLFRNLDNLITLHQRIKINITGDYHDKKDK